METKLGKTLTWTPRVAGILFALFISIFALDVFQEGLGFGEIALALLLHLLPTFLFLAAIALAWRWEWVGALVFGGFGLFYLFAVREFDWVAYAILGGIPLLIGLLFGLGWFQHRRVVAA